MADTSHSVTDVVIIGGGIAGLACGVSLKQKGVKVQIYEKAKSMLPIGAAIGLFPNGLAAIKGISPNLLDKVIASSVATERVQTWNLQNEIVREVDATTMGASAPRYLVWYLLQQFLRESLSDEVVRMGHSFVSYSVDEATGLVHVKLLDRKTSFEKVHHCRVLIGADGIKSSVRDAMFRGEELGGQNFYGKMMFRSVIPEPLVHPMVYPTKGIALSYHGEEAGKLFSYRVTADGIMTVTAMALFNQPAVLLPGDEAKERLKEIFVEFPAPVQSVIESMPPSSIFENAVADMEVLQCWSEGPVVLIGDAAHAMTPGLGQGANMGLEDACELSSVLSMLASSQQLSDPDVVCACLSAFSQERRRRVEIVHAASRAQTLNNNKATKDAPVRATGNVKEFQDKLYSWQPSAAVSPVQIPGEDRHQEKAN